MPFFNFREAGSSPAHQSTSATQPDSVEVIRQRAKHRLIGASVLVLLGVVGFPLLFDTQPRPIAVDIPIEIPGKNTVKPLVLPAKAAAVAIAPAPTAVAPETPALAQSATATPAPVAAAPVSAKVAAASSLAPKEEIITEKRPVAQVSAPDVAIKKEAKVAPKAEAKAEAKKEPMVEPKVEPKVAAKVVPKVDAKPVPAVAMDDGARARALLNGQGDGPATTPVAAATEGRMVVQVGAFADATKAHETRLKLEKAGLKTYTQVADTKDGKRIRVRVGPFATKAEADKAASKIKALDLPAAILIL